MNMLDYFSGSTHFATSGGLAAEWLLIPSEVVKQPLPDDYSPVFYTDPAPVIVTSYEIYQATGGTAIVLLFFDATTLPPDGTSLDGAADLKWIQKLGAAPDGFTWNPSGPGHRYNNALGVIASTSDSTITRAAAKVLFSASYMSYRVG